jgi:BAG domain-containing protein
MTVLKVNTYLTQPDEGAQLSRSHALKGATAEAAKASFKAHRAEVAEKEEPSPTSPTSRTLPSSLSIIQDIRSALTKLSAGFSLPLSLDFSDDEPNGLAYTPTNAPVRVYEHALDKLLEQLDAVESDGDEEVRVERKAAVKEVEKAIEDVETKIRESRGSAKPASGPGSAVSAEADLTESMNIDGAVEENPSVDNDEPEAEEPSSKSSNRVDSAPSSPEIVPLPNPEVAIPKVADPTESKSKSVPDDDIGPVVTAAPVTCPSLGPTDRVEASVPTDDTSEWKHEVLVEQATTDRTSAPSESAIVITPLDSPSVPILGAIARSSTPVPPLVIAEELPALPSSDRLSVSLGEYNTKVYDADDESEWTKI